MAKYAKFQLQYDAIEKFRDTCLLQDKSILWPTQSIWTISNLQQWKIHVIDRPNTQKLTFTDKLEIQLADAPPILWGLAADLFYVFYLPSASIRQDTRQKTIAWAAQRSSFVVPIESDPVWFPQKDGFTYTTHRYNYRYAQLQLLATFALKIKETDNARQILSDPNSTQSILDEILDEIPAKSDRARDFRHAFLYLLFPDLYEPIISTSAKEKINNHYGHLITGSTTDLDKRLLQIRKKLIKERGLHEEFHFYEDIRSEWDPDEKELPGDQAVKDEVKDGTNPPKGEAIVIKNGLRLLEHFKNVILYGPPGTGKTYWAKLLAKKKIENQLQQPITTSVFLQSVIQNMSYYDLIALQMALQGQEKKYTVPQLRNMDLIQIRLKEKSVKAPNNILWNYLQSHTSPESKTVNMTLRNEPYLFDKTKNSEWFLTSDGKRYVSEDLQEKLDKIRQGPPPHNSEEDFIHWITFHQSYAYEDFVEGLRPITDQGDAAVLSFEMKPGLFRSLCLRAKEDPKNDYVLIIDEINRGNISKIFGELMTLIESDKREVLSVELPYSKENFSVPNNLMIIATMNTADRSIALMDVALRRRFAFLELLPEAELLDKIEISLAEEDTFNLGNFLRSLNARIIEYRGNDYQIGHSYFLPLSDIVNEDYKLTYLDDIWNFQVLPLMNEYFYGQGDVYRGLLPSFFEDLSDDTVPSAKPAILHGNDLIAALNMICDL